jgi:hypothetical protein
VSAFFFWRGDVECIEALLHDRMSVTIDAPTWFLARARAMSHLGTDRVEWMPTKWPADIRLRWEGTDAGRVPTLRIVEEAA